MKTRVELKLSRDRQCPICKLHGEPQMTETVPAHYTGPMQFWFGKGMGKKCDDLFTADLCDRHHKMFDQYHGVSTEEQKLLMSHDFLFAILMSLYQDLLEGRLFFK